MGTNYYIELERCPCCGHAKTVFHIGKSSYGWAFALHVIPEQGLDSWEAWTGLLERRGVVIRDEYGEEVPYQEFVRVVTERDTNFRPLVHCPPGEGFCRGSEGGSWDLVEGDFS